MHSNRIQRAAVVGLAGVLTAAAAVSCQTQKKVTTGGGGGAVALRPTTVPVSEAVRMIDNRPAWTDFPPVDVPRHPSEKYLKGLVICIDPGHGGEDGGDPDQRRGYKSGRTGAKEAHMNLRVSLLLERLLTDAGAHVVMIRRADDTVSLERRAEIANTCPRPDGGTGADLFVSVHHNASSSETSNFTSVWYHGTVDNAAVALDLATPIALRVSGQIRTEEGKTSPALSDQLMYASGFAVLRRSNVPAVLCELSFYTNRAEEQRLLNADHNLREAYGIYEGLCDYAYLGRPTQATPAVREQGSEVVVTTTLDDGLPDWWGKERLRILPSTILVTLDGRGVPCVFDTKTRTITARVPRERLAKSAMLRVEFENMFKHSNWPQRYRIEPGPNGAPSRVTVMGNFAPLGYVPAARPTTAPATQPAGTRAGR